MSDPGPGDLTWKPLPCDALLQRTMAWVGRRYLQDNWQYCKEEDPGGIWTAVPLEPEKFTGPIPAHSIAWTCRATTLACSQHIPGCGIEQGCNFSFNRKIVKSRGLFSKLQKITQWKNYRHFPSEKSGWDQGLHALCQMMLCPLIASGEQAWARWTAWDVIINWPQWHSFTKCPSLCLVL